MGFSNRRNDAATQALTNTVTDSPTSKINWAEQKFPKSLVYPDLGDKFYPDCICFTVQKRTGVSIENVGDAIGKSISSMGESLGKAYDAFGQRKARNNWIDQELSKLKPTQANIEAATATLKDKWNTDNPGKTTSIKDLGEGFIRSAQAGSKLFKEERDKALAVAKEGKNILGSIYLNMPNGIQFNEAANWSGDSLGFMGKTTQDMITGEDSGATQVLGTLVGSTGNIVGAGIGALPSLISKLGLKGGMFGMAIGAMAAGTPIQKGAESALGIAQNPYMEMMFSGVGFRKFQFEFILRPKSQTEVETVAEIIQMFRTHSKPSYTQGALGKAFMDYPMEFKIDFLTSGAGPINSNTASRRGEDDGSSNFVTNSNIPQLKDCVCDNVTTNYTPQNIWAAYKEGAPIAVNLNLSFQETELVMADDVYKGGY